MVFLGELSFVFALASLEDDHVSVVSPRLTFLAKCPER